ATTVARGAQGRLSPAPRPGDGRRPPGAYRGGAPRGRTGGRGAPRRRAREDLAARICGAVRAGDGPQVAALLDRLERTGDTALLDRVAQAVRALDLPAS
ncbi:hypothetical protein ACFV0G_15150, partial [Kitasatospora sp. NPDC059571]